jgi:hypothetical protein
LPYSGRISPRATAFSERLETGNDNAIGSQAAAYTGSPSEDRWLPKKRNVLSRLVVPWPPLGRNVVASSVQVADNPGSAGSGGSTAHSLLHLGFCLRKAELLKVDQQAYVLPEDSGQAVTADLNRTIELAHIG